MYRDTSFIPIIGFSRKKLSSEKQYYNLYYSYIELFYLIAYCGMKVQWVIKNYNTIGNLNQ